MIYREIILSFLMQTQKADLNTKDEHIIKFFTVVYIFVEYLALDILPF